MSTIEEMPASLQGEQASDSQPGWVAGIHSWFQKNTFSPPFLSGVWAHPAWGYLIAGVLQLAVVAVLFAILQPFPAFHFPEGPLFLVILLAALGWGVGPGILATLVGACLLLYLVLPPAFTLTIGHTEDVFSLGLYIIFGLAISIIASNTQRARRESERLRLRLDAVINAIPDSLVLYDRQGRRVQQNRRAREIEPVENPPLTLAEMPKKLLLRKPSGELFPQEGLPLARALQGEVVAGAELVYRTPETQQDRFVTVSAAPLYTSDGRAIEGADYRYS